MGCDDNGLPRESAEAQTPVVNLASSFLPLTLQIALTIYLRHFIFSHLVFLNIYHSPFRCRFPHPGNKIVQMQNPSSSEGDQNFQIRRLDISDKNKGFIELLGQLTVADPVTEKEFDERFHEISSHGDDHIVCVIEDVRTGKIVATGSVFVEKKFVRKCGKAAHIEDLVVDSSVRGKHLGKKLVEFLADHASAVGCYKVILDCSVGNAAFYEKCGFQQKAVQMSKYFN